MMLKRMSGVILGLLLASCGSSDEGTAPVESDGMDPTPQDPSDPAIDPDPTGDPPGDPDPTEDPSTVALDPPASGFQLQAATRDVVGGDDVEWCEVVAVPGESTDEYYVNQIEIALGPNSHHTNVMAVSPGSGADAATVVGDVVPCVANGQQPYGDGLYNIGGAAGRLSVNEFPDGVGVKLTGGQKLVVNMHYVNTSADVVPGTAVMNFHVAEPGVVLQEMRRFGWYNMTLNLPPNSQTSTLMECRVTQDMYVHALFRHTHRLGMGFDMWFAGGERDGEHIWHGDQWNENLGTEFDEPVLVRAGEGFRFQCDFDNTEDQTIVWGDTGSDEMCILYGRWYSADPTVAPSNQSCVAIGGMQPDAAGVFQGFNCPTCP